jgi:hypothetical protein
MRPLLLSAIALVLATGTARADDFALVGGVSAIELRTRDADGKMGRFGEGFGASITMLCACDDATAGFEASTLFLIGDDDSRVYDLGISGILSFQVEDKIAVPFITFGLDMSAVGLTREGTPARDHGVSLGVHGAAGLHGFVGERAYWRAAVGYLGAGVNGLTGQVTLGYAFGRD